MISNYFKFAWRRILADKRTAAINLLGLTIGLASFIMIVQYVLYEKSYDQFHRNKDRLYRLGLEVYRDNRLNIRSAINYPGVGPAVKKEFPEVEDYVRLSHEPGMVQVGTQHFREDKLYFADEAFFKFFSVNVLDGDATKALTQPNSAAIAVSVAKKYYGTANCTGKTIRIENHFAQRDFLITAVFDDIPEQSHLQGNIFVSFNTYYTRPGYLQDWQWRDFYTYVLLKPQTDVPAFEQKITRSDFVNNHEQAFAQRNMRHALLLQPVKDIYLWSDLVHEIKPTGSGRMVNYFMIIAIFVLAMAWINYINLSTSMAIKRTKEIGVRKAIGAVKKNLIIQFLTEAFLLNSMALVIALLASYLLQPLLSSFTGKNISIPLYTWAALSLFIILAVLASVAYPASVLSKFSPVKALKNEKLSTTGGNTLRKSLIVFQFTVSTVLIISTAVVLLQLKHIQNAKLGLNLAGALVVRAPLPNDSAAYEKYLVFKQQLLNNPAVKKVTASHIVPGDEEQWTPAIRKFAEPGAVTGQSITCAANAIEPGFLAQYEIPVKYGRDLSKDNIADNRSILLTETACKKLNYDKPADALNQRLILLGDEFIVVGITGDFRHHSTKYEAEPYVFFQRNDEYRKYSVKITGADLASTIAFVKTTYDAVFPQGNFEYRFADELFSKQFDADRRAGMVVSVVTVIAVIIACLGLFGLTVFVTRQRVKEIGIRKTLGASVTSIILLLSKDFAKLVLIAALVAIPVTWFAMQKWLQGFADKASIGWYVFAAAGLLIVLIAFFTVGFQAIKAAMANPVKSLRTE
ncbi:MAG: ABC transporter permease [Ferruginibacter sp.]